VLGNAMEVSLLRGRQEIVTEVQYDGILMRFGL
jgi:hypothetical protein